MLVPCSCTCEGYIFKYDNVLYEKIALDESEDSIFIVQSFINEYEKFIEAIFCSFSAPFNGVCLSQFLGNLAKSKRNIWSRSADYIAFYSLTLISNLE